MDRTLLPQNTYSFTIQQSYHNEKRTILYLCFTIDTGRFKYRRLIEEFPTKENLTQALDRFVKSVNFEPQGLPTEENYPQQFIGLRTVGDVDVIERDGFWVNKIKSYDLPEGHPEVNMLEEKTDEHYYTETPTKKKLPIL